jgi:S-(hydroxymethyl)glutathione dehydrogenase/alcohol dehydrogenase
MTTTDQKLSRREILAAGIAATGSVLAATTAGAVPAPGITSSSPNVTGRKFRAWVSQGEGLDRTKLETLTMLPISGRQIAVRTQATSLCYTVSSDVLGLPAGEFGAPDAAHLLHVPPPSPIREQLRQMALIQGHGGVGIVEAVGPDVRRAKVGDRVCVSGTPQCGNCYQCLRGRADQCQFLGHQGPKDLVALATRDDGTPVYANSHIGGLAGAVASAEHGVQLHLRRGTWLHGVADAGDHRSKLGRGGRGLRGAGADRHPGRTHLRRLDHHRHRPDQRAP